MRDIRPHQPTKQEFPIGYASSNHKEVDFFEATEISKKKLVKPSATASQLLPAAEQQIKLATTKKTSTGNLQGNDVPITNIEIPSAMPNYEEQNDFKKKRPMFARPQSPKPARVRVGNNERKIILSFFGLALLVAVIGGAIFIPTATISMQLKTAPLLINEEITVSSLSGNNAIPGQVFTREINVSDTHKVTNSENVGVKSSGAVNIINRTNETQPIKENSRLVTDNGTLFYMKNHAIVPPNSSVRVEIEAGEPGDQGNIEQQKLYFAALDESARQILYAETIEKITGGKSEMISVVSENDFDQAKQSAIATARQKAEGEIRNDLPDNWTILEESWNSELKSFNPSAKVNDKTPEFAYTASVAVKAIGYEKEALESRLKQLLEKQISENYMLFPGPIAYSQTIKNVDWNQSSATLSVRVTHTTIPKLSLDTLKEKMAGRSSKEAQSYIEGLPAVKSATIKLWPFWVSSIPRIERRISIDLKPDKIL